MAGNTATVGITEFAKDQLGDVVYLELPDVGAAVTKVNSALVEAPEGINEDPHEKGWMIEIELNAPGEAAELLSAKQYEELLANEH
ncbi:MAG TPA: hypothetical protein VKH65_06750 [Myxococcales bacterium]|nr:hypothetical protein [Myxococcales bacterium]